MGDKSRWTLPDVVHPTTYRRFVVCVPNNRFYIAAFQGLLVELTYSKNWQRDSLHTAAQVSRVWQHALENVLCDDCGEIIRVEESDYQMSICEQLRFVDGKLQGLCCGEWVDIDGQESFPPGGGGQPGGGTSQPEPGGCETYHANMQASGKYYVPTIVSTGDTIEIQNDSGAGNDGIVGPWHCPDGSSFFAGACLGGTGGPYFADPLPATDHMQLIANIGGTFYEIYGSVFTVPGGHTNVAVYIQANDSDLTDNAGDYTFDIEVCNNAAALWVREIDFTLTPGGFTPRGTPTFNIPAGVWIPGSGWGTVDVNDGGEAYRRIDLNRVCVACNIETVEMELQFTAGVYNALTAYCQYAEGGINNDSGAVVNGSPVILNSSAGTTGTTLLQLIGISSADTAEAGLDGSCTIRRVKWTGHGTPPF